MATLPGMRERTITISGASKTFSITGWRIGTIVAPAEVTDAIRKVHDFLTVGAPAPLMEGLAVAMEVLGRDYYENLAGEYRARREIMMGALVKAGFKCVAPDGAYYILADFSGISDLPAPEFARWLTIKGGIATVPGTSFWSKPEDGIRFTRFAFCKTHDLLDAAVKRLETLPRSGGRS
jgi:aminotransferase